ncbi:hypothetical protein FHS83_002758 [Rhizomicrobium palustre]|jgi:hypothetical protein|uniref:Uncharacterized protein n=1 Tax=Rhizomicrobium palustre TaxID=189966 RepID=A0A846N2X9_9PROT|nr:hypothetical protein [Rhizomicrobium palustre]NIK89440.1 hypothetical protein [Rhizomicrobium palustre]
MTAKIKRDVDGLTHSKPGSVDQQAEDSFPASDSPSFSPGAIGAPVERETPPLPASPEAKKHPKDKVSGDKK